MTHWNLFSESGRYGVKRVDFFTPVILEYPNVIPILVVYGQSYGKVKGPR